MLRGEERSTDGTGSNSRPSSVVVGQNPRRSDSCIGGCLVVCVVVEEELRGGDELLMVCGTRVLLLEIGVW
jgi:hypothetical protein